MMKRISTNNGDHKAIIMFMLMTCNTTEEDFLVFEGQITTTCTSLT